MIHQMVAPRRPQPAAFPFVNKIPRYVVSTFKMVVAGMNPVAATLAPASFAVMIVAANPLRRNGMRASMLKPANDI